MEMKMTSKIILKNVSLKKEHEIPENVFTPKKYTLQFDFNVIGEENFHVRVEFTEGQEAFKTLSTLHDLFMTIGSKSKLLNKGGDVHE
jgi:hypothetical protein